MGPQQLVDFMENPQIWMGTGPKMGGLQMENHGKSHSNKCFKKKEKKIKDTSISLAVLVCHPAVDSFWALDVGAATAASRSDFRTRSLHGDLPNSWVNHGKSTLYELYVMCIEDITHATKFLLYPCTSALPLYWIHQGPFLGSPAWWAMLWLPKSPGPRTHKSTSTRLTFCGWFYCFLARSKSWLGGNWINLQQNKDRIYSIRSNALVCFGMPWTQVFLLPWEFAILFGRLSRATSLYRIHHISTQSLQKSLKKSLKCPEFSWFWRCATQRGKSTTWTPSRYKLHFGFQIKHAWSTSLKCLWIFRVSRSGRISFPLWGCPRCPLPQPRGNQHVRDTGIWTWIGELVKPELNYPSRYICQGHSGREPGGVVV